VNNLTENQIQSTTAQDAAVVEETVQELEAEVKAAEPAVATEYHQTLEAVQATRDALRELGHLPAAIEEIVNHLWVRGIGLVLHKDVPPQGS